MLAKSKKTSSDKQLSLGEHLEELRGRIIKSLIFLIISSAVIFNGRNIILPFLIKSAGKLVFIAPQEAFLTNIKIAFLGGLLVSSPAILYQVWRFTSSGLLPRERRYVLLFCPLSFILFIAGFAFGYLIIVPLGIKFLLQFATPSIAPMLTFSKYISFVAALSFAFAVVFQLPLIILFLTKAGIANPSFFAKKRREAIVIIFIAAAIFTPPDAVTQILMAVPLVLLYELGIIFSKIAYKKHA